MPSKQVFFSADVDQSKQTTTKGQQLLSLEASIQVTRINSADRVADLDKGQAGDTKGQQLLSLEGSIQVTRITQQTEWRTLTMAAKQAGSRRVAGDRPNISPAARSSSAG